MVRGKGKLQARLVVWNERAAIPFRSIDRAEVGVPLLPGRVAQSGAGMVLFPQEIANRNPLPGAIGARGAH